MKHQPPYFSSQLSIDMNINKKTHNNLSNDNPHKIETSSSQDMYGKCNNQVLCNLRVS